MKVLLACEESQIVCKEFRKRGHEAYSCDILPCSGGHPEWHIQDDILEYIEDGYDMMIAFPPCTHLAVSGAAWFEEKRKDGRQREAIEFFMALIDAPIKKKSIENPVNIISGNYITEHFPELAEKYNLPIKPDQVIHPYYFGDPETKATCLWLKNLPLLKHYEEDDMFNKKTHVEPEFITSSSGKKYSRIHWIGGGKGHERSKTYPGIAKAMAEQWG